MIIDPETWSKMHGAATHFPIALMLVSAFCDAAGLIPGDAERQRGFRFAAKVTLVLGALGGCGAVATGLIVTKGSVWGHGALLRHHQFVWPAFALMIGLAVWRLLAGGSEQHRPCVVYLTLMILAVGLMSAAGYFGGELLSHG